jgi:hypothetical protein
MSGKNSSATAVPNTGFGPNKLSVNAPTLDAARSGRSRSAHQKHVAKTQPPCVHASKHAGGKRVGGKRAGGKHTGGKHAGGAVSCDDYMDDTYDAVQHCTPLSTSDSTQLVEVSTDLTSEEWPPIKGTRAIRVVTLPQWPCASHKSAVPNA